TLSLPLVSTAWVSETSAFFAHHTAGWELDGQGRVATASPPVIVIGFRYAGIGGRRLRKISTNATPTPVASRARLGIGMRSSGTPRFRFIGPRNNGLSSRRPSVAATATAMAG